MLTLPATFAPSSKLLSKSAPARVVAARGVGGRHAGVGIEKRVAPRRVVDGRQDGSERCGVGKPGLEADVEAAVLLGAGDSGGAEDVDGDRQGGAGGERVEA